MAGRLLRVTALNSQLAAYSPVLRLQEALFEQRRAGAIPDTLLQLEARREGGHKCSPPLPPPAAAPFLHPPSPALPLPPPLRSAHLLQHSPVYTVGKRGGPADFLTAADELAASGANVVASPRGGETTYHGPGQLVVYPIVNLRELGVGARAYVEGLEDAMVRALGAYGIAARVRECCLGAAVMVCLTLT